VTTPKDVASSAAERDPSRIASDPPALILFRPRWGRDWVGSRTISFQIADARESPPRGYALDRGQDEEGRASLSKSTRKSEQEDETQMRPQAGDRIVVESERWRSLAGQE
jgi:hypothetical protein